MCARTTTSERQAGTVPVGRRFGLALVTEDWSRRPEGGGPPLPPPSPPPLLIKAMLGRVDSPALSPLPLPPGPPFCDFSRIHKIQTDTEALRFLLLRATTPVVYFL